MSRYTAEEIRSGLKNGSRDVLFYLARRYFQTSRRWLRTKGFRDADTPMIFSDALVRLMREAQQKQFPAQTEIRELFSNVLRNYVRELRRQAMEGENDDPAAERQEVIARCFNVLDGPRQQLLTGRYADRLSFEELATRLGYSNAIIAEAELDRSFFSLEQIADVRLSLAVRPDVPFSGSEARRSDRYLEGALTGSELSDFQNRLLQEPGLEGRIAFRREVIQGVRQASDDLLAKEVASTIGYRRSVLPFGLKLLLGFGSVILVVLLGWNYLGSDTASDRPVLSFRWLNKVGSIIRLNSGQDATSSGKDAVKKEELSVDGDETPVTYDSLESTLDIAADSLAAGAEADFSETDIVVRKDVLLMTVQVTPVVLESGAAPDKPASMADAAARTLNPAAGLPLTEEPETRLEVELWSSPVNYKGYRRTGNNISLYGFESTEGLGFYRLEERVFVRSETDLFELIPSENYQSYRTVHDHDLLERCR